MNIKYLITFCLFLLLPLDCLANNCANKKEEIRAYIIDDNSGTRSGPIRCLTSQAVMNLLKADKAKLEYHSQGTFQSSGFTKPGEKHWTTLPADSIFN